MKKTLKRQIKVLFIALTAAVSGLLSVNALSAPDTSYEYGTPHVYDIYDLTGSGVNTILGTNDTWDGQIKADISAQHKENMAFRCRLTMGAQQVRLSLNAKDGANIYDPPGYSVYLYGDTGRVEIRKNNSSLVNLEVDGVAGTYVFEAGIVDVLSGTDRVGKHVYVKMDDTVVCSYDDTNGYLTGDALGTKIVDFHYGASIQMDTTYTTEYGTPKVYDIYDLTGNEANTILGTDSTWDGQIKADISAQNKENMAFRCRLTMGAQQVRLSLNAKDGASIYDPPGYSVYLYGDTGRVEIRKNNSSLVNVEAAGVAGTYVFEAGIVDILFGGSTIGKHIYVKMDDTVVCSYDDMDGYLTGDALGTKIVDFHYGAATQMDAVSACNYGVALSLSDSFDILFTVNVLAGEPSDYTVDCIFNGEELTGRCSSKGQNVFTAARCAAKQMTDEVSIFVKHGGSVIYSVNYSILDYCSAQIERGGGSKLAELCKAVLNFGAAAQKYFRYGTDRLANSGYEYSELANVPPEYNRFVSSASIYKASASLVLESMTTINFKIAGGDGLSYSVKRGEKNIAAEPVVLSDGRTCISVTGIGPLMLDDVYTLTVSDGTNEREISYSALSYAQRMQGRESTGEVCRALYNYYVKASAYVDKDTDKPIVLDLYELTGEKTVTVPSGKVMQLGELVGLGDGSVKKEITNNVAIRFRYTGGEGMRFQFGGGSPEISYDNGALFMSVPDNKSFGIADIRDNGSWSRDAGGNDLFTWQECLGRGEGSYIELGCVRRYTDGEYTHDRYYVRAAATLEELDRMSQEGTFSTYHDTAMRNNNGHLLLIRSRMDGGGDVLATTWTDSQCVAYETKLQTLSRNASRETYNALERKYPSLVSDTSNTAYALAAAEPAQSLEAAGDDELILWAESGVSKIVQNDGGKAAGLAAEKDTLVIQMAKNEDEGAQLMLFGRRNVDGYEVFVTDLVSGDDVISAEDIRLYQLKYLTVDDKTSGYYSTPAAYAGGKIPDAMLPFAKAVEYGENVLAAGNNQAIYVDVSTDASTAAGTYTGTIAVRTDTGAVYTLPVEVTVGDVTLPDVPELGTYAPYISRDAFSTGELDGSDELAGLYLQTLRDYNMSSAVPGSDGIMNIERFLINVRRSYDSVSNYILPVDTTDSYYRVGGTDTLVYCNYALLKEYIVALADMSVADGRDYLSKAFFYPYDHVDESKTSDEFDLAKQTYRAFCQMLDDADAELSAKYEGSGRYTAALSDSVRTVRFLLTIPADDNNGRALDVGTLLNSFLGAADRRNVVLSTSNDVLVREGYGDDVASAMNGQFASELWTYLSLKPMPPYSNYAFDTPVVGLRVLGWTCYQENVSTLMTWRSVNYLYDSDGLPLDRWSTSSAGKSCITPGDGNMFYPGAKYGIDGPCPSLRAIAWRDGVDDYSLMRAVEERGGSASALSELYGLITESYTDTIKASSVTGSWWSSLFDKRVNAAVPVDDDARFAIVRGSLLEMASSAADSHAAIISETKTEIAGISAAGSAASALEDASIVTVPSAAGNIYTDGYYRLADFETYTDTVRNKLTGNAVFGLSDTAQSGSHSLKVAVQPGQKGGSIWIPTVSGYFSAATDFSGAQKITFKVFNAQDADRTVRFYMNTYDRSSSVYNMGTYTKASADIWHDDHPENASVRTVLAPGWNEVTVDLSVFGTGYRSYVGAFIITFDSGVGYDTEQVFYLDDVRVYMNKVS